MFRRIFLFVLTNIAIIIVGTVVLSLIQIIFGINITNTLHTSYVSLGVFSLLYGFGASFVSLLLSRWMAKKANKIQLITDESLLQAIPSARLVYQTVAYLASQHNITMPEVWIYQSPEVNAFATGATKNSSLVAVSSGLLDSLQSDEIEWVIAHEMAHIINGDMVTMTLLQWIINAFVIFLSRAIAQIISMSWRGNGEWRSQLTYFFTTIILEVLLGIGGSLIVMTYSRHREFAADAGSALFVGKNKMIKALRALQGVHARNAIIAGDAKVAAFKIDGKSGGFMWLFASHPSLEVRIERLMKV